MKTSQAPEVRKVDDRTPAESHARPETSAPSSPTGHVLRRAVIAVLTVLLIAVVTVAVVWVASNSPVEQAATEESQLLDRSVRARDTLGLGAQPDTLLDRSVRARDTLGLGAQPDTLLDRSVRARDTLGLGAQPDTLLDRSVRARER